MKCHSKVLITDLDESISLLLSRPQWPVATRALLALQLAVCS
jgi:hypothetical protein